MYTPSHFLESNHERIAKLIDENGFAILISGSATALQITHVPMQLDRAQGGRGVLIGHIARANPHSGLLVDGADVCVVFHGPHSYISPTWYVDESSRDLNVPTWNYVAVHIYGRVLRRNTEIQKWKIVTELAAQYEKEAARQWDPGKLAEHADKLGAIIGFEVVIDRIEAKSKLSQNRSAADQENVIRNLELENRPDGRAVARLMRENLTSGTKDGECR